MSAGKDLGSKLTWGEAEGGLSGAVGKRGGGARGRGGASEVRARLSLAFWRVVESNLDGCQLLCFAGREERIHGGDEALLGIAEQRLGSLDNVDGILLARTRNAAHHPRPRKRW